jgi:hypothetical protein
VTKRFKYHILYLIIGEKKMKHDVGSSYYVDNKPKLMKQFRKALNFTRDILNQYYEEEKTENLISEIKIEVDNLLPELPYIGGKKNGLTSNLVASAYSLAVIKVLERIGQSERDIGKILYEMSESYFKSKSRFLKWLYPRIIFSKFIFKRGKKKTEKSQLKKYPEDWVFEIVKGDGTNFDVGITYTECGICKFYEKMDALQYVPYLCLSDYAMAREFRIGLIRTQTIGNGAQSCDFRFKKNYETPSGWSPENMEEFRMNKVD